MADINELFEKRPTVVEGGSIAWVDVTGKPTFSTVATSGDYNDLINKPAGINSSSLSVTTTFTIPVLASSQTQEFDDVSWVTVGMPVFLSDDTNYGSFEVTNISTNTLTLKNTWGQTTGTTIAIGAVLSPTGYPGGAGSNGADGASSYTYIAYADDNSGTGFTTTFDANKDYIAFKTTTSPIVSPTSSDFTGLWKNYKGGTGTSGSAATITVGTVTTGSAGSSVSVTNVGTSSAAIFDITIPRGDAGSAGTAGVDGTDGLNADITRTSTSSVAIGTGSKTFTYTASSNLGWLVGTRLRSSYDGSNYVEGAITSIGSGTVTINVDNAVGSGTYTAWNLTVAGDKGTTGTIDPSLTENAQTGTSYTLVLSDAGKLVTMNNASANTLTVPPNSSVAFPTGTQILVGQKGVGTTTYAYGSGVTLNGASANKTSAGQWKMVTLIKISTDGWWISGGIS